MLVESLGYLDTFIIGVFFVITIGLGLVFSRKTDTTKKDYFLGSGDLGWITIGCSLFATNISSEHFLGLASAGASKGLSVGSFEWMAIFVILYMGWFLAPVFIRLKIYTVPEFLEIRYDRRSRNYLATISVFAYILTKISVMLYAGGFLLNKLLGWDLYTTALIMVLLTGLYTVSGGLAAVVRTQIFHATLIIASGLTITIIGLNEVGWISGLQAKLPSEYFQLFRPASDPDLPWTGIIFGAPILGFWYWCTDQYIVHRILGAKSVKDVHKGSILAAILKVFPLFILILPGLLAVAIFPNIPTEQVFPTFLSSNLIPAGFKGFIVAGIMAALMSSLASVFNSTATLITLDYYLPRNPDASDRKLVLVGRLTTLMVVFTAILWVPLTKFISTDLYIYMQSVQAYIAPPIVAVFIFGIYTKFASATGAIWCLTVGGIIGFVRLLSEFLVQNQLTDSSLIVAIVQINYLHFAILLFIVSIGVLSVVSYAGNRSRSVSVSYKENFEPGWSSTLKIGQIKWGKGFFFTFIFFVAVAFYLQEMFR